MAVDRKTEQQLELDQIQGDVLIGLQKDHEVFLGFHIAQIPPFKTFLKHLVSEITTGKKVFERELQLQALKATGSKTRLTLIGVNIGFTFSGLQALGVLQLNKISDASFTAGLFARSASLGDPVAGEGAPANWKLGKDISLHGLVIITGPDQPNVAAKVADLKSKAGAAWVVTFEEEGMTREFDRGHEHFGYLDGVSQPAVRGRIDHLFPGHTFLEDSLNPGDPNQGLPGADLHWPGEFVFGYAGQKASDVEGPDAPTTEAYPG
jgi:deferrochelatase/peroxidase EfeB